MKKSGLRTAGLLLILTVAAGAQTSTWSEDYAKNVAEAKTSGKYVLLNFGGSDWCSWCKKLDKEVFSRTAFKEYAAASLLPVLIDSPRSKPMKKEILQQNESLIQKYGIQGFPTIILLSPDGDLVGQTGYQYGGAEKYVEHLKGIISEYQRSKKAE
ncbi:thioredoxin family protein [bacterium]|nr:thioredoxin family protein [bacterium]